MKFEWHRHEGALREGVCLYKAKIEDIILNATLVAPNEWHWTVFGKVDGVAVAVDPAIPERTEEAAKEMAEMFARRLFGEDECTK